MRGVGAFRVALGDRGGMGENAGPRGGPEEMGNVHGGRPPDLTDAVVAKSGVGGGIGFGRWSPGPTGLRVFVWGGGLTDPSRLMWEREGRRTLSGF